MPEATWEDRIYNDLNDSNNTDPGNMLMQELQPDEESVARELMSHMRHMATNQKAPTDETDFFLAKDINGEYAPDNRPINPYHTVLWTVIEHHGDYWEVRYGSNEFSSSFSAMARGRTLAEALYNVGQEG